MTRSHDHYFRSVRRLDEIDVYRVHQLFQLGRADESGALHHASKKLLLAGQRGAGKSLYRDIEEARDTLNRKLAMMDEDQAAGAVMGSRTPVGADLRFDQSGRQEAVEQNGNTGEHYLPEGVTWDMAPQSAVALVSADHFLGDEPDMLFVWVPALEGVVSGVVAREFGSQIVGSHQVCDLSHPGNMWRLVSLRPEAAAA